MKKLFLAFTAIISIGLGASFANYTMTQGAGTTFGSVVVGGFHYVQMFVCDLTTPSQCQSVSAAGAAKVDGSAVIQPVSSTTLSTAANQTSQITQETATAAALGTTTDAVGATPSTGSAATLIALAKAINNNVSSAIPAGNNLIGKVGIDQTTPGLTNLVAAGQNGTWTVQPGNTANTTPWLTTDAAGTSGGASSSYLQPTASDNHANIKNGAGTAYSVHTSNNSATKNYLRLYDAGTGFNGCGSATGLIFGMEIPPSDGGFSVLLGGSKGLAFTTGLSICVTSGYGSTDTTAATATAIMSNVIYK